MKLWKVCSLVAGLGLLLILASCSSGAVSRNDTEAFLVGLTMMFGQAMMDEASQVLLDFEESEPPGPELMNYTEILGKAPTGKLRNPDPFGLDTIYGTWDYVDIQGWVHIDPNNPASAILFTWDYLDTAMVQHDAELLIDSLEFYADTLPTNVWMGISLDDALIAWLKLEAEYLSLEEVNEVSLIYEIVNHFQIGISISSAAAIDTIFTGTVSLWAIDRTNNNYRIDLVITLDESYPERIVLSDSRRWEMDVTISDVVETDGEFERRDVSGEITRNGAHAAEISGYIWDPEDASHTSEIVITFSDDTEGDLGNYLPIDFDLEL